MSTPPMTMKTPIDLFLYELSEIHSAEQILAQVLEQAPGMVQNPQLQQGLLQHAQETRQQIGNLEQIFQQMGAQPLPTTSHAAQGLQQSLQEVIQADPSPDVLEGAVVAAQAKAEHLEIACYTGLIAKAQAMGQTEVAQLLGQNLQQEQAQAQRIEGIAQQLAQQQAAMMGVQGGDQVSASM